jgi:flagellar basal-body rod modification protein FlgD
MANPLNINSSTSVSTTDPFAPRTASSGNSTTQVTKNMFLQLLVAQIKNQDPMSPSDGVQFLSQLAQFQQLENGMNMGQDISAIRADLDQAAKAASATSKTGDSAGTTNN